MTKTGCRQREISQWGSCGGRLWSVGRLDKPVPKFGSLSVRLVTRNVARPALPLYYCLGATDCGRTRTLVVVIQSMSSPYPVHAQLSPCPDESSPVQSMSSPSRVEPISIRVESMSSRFESSPCPIDSLPIRVEFSPFPVQSRSNPLPVQFMFSPVHVQSSRVQSIPSPVHVRVQSMSSPNRVHVETEASAC
jgi:hypothetical protein